MENFDFEVVDPVAVHQEAATTRVLLWSLIGGLAGGLLGLMFRRAD